MAEDHRRGSCSHPRDGVVCLHPSRGPESIASVQDHDDDSSREGGSVIAPVAAGDPTEKLGMLLEKLMERVEGLEQRQPRFYQRRSRSSGMPMQVPRGNRRRRQFAGLCWNCQQPGHLTWNCPQKAAPDNLSPPVKRAQHWRDQYKGLTQL